MADWTITWVPQVVEAYSFGPEFKTAVSEFGNGGEQRRQKWSRQRYHFYLSFNGLSDTVINAIRVFFEARAGAYEAFNFPNYAQKISGTRLALAEGGAGADTITDSSSGFVTTGFNSNIQVCVNGSATPANNKHYTTITTVAAGTITLPAGSLTASDSANASLEAYCSYSVRYKEDQFINSFLKSSVGSIRTIELIEVI